MVEQLTFAARLQRVEDQLDELLGIKSSKLKEAMANYKGTMKGTVDLMQELAMLKLHLYKLDTKLTEVIQWVKKLHGYKTK